MKSEITSVRRAGPPPVSGMIRSNVLNDAMVMSESLVVVTVALASYCAIRFVRLPNTSRAVAFGSAAALAALTRAELLAYLPLVLAWFAFTHRRSWRSWAKASIVAAFTLVVLISPWAIRNTIAFDRLVLLSNGSGTVLVQANCDATYLALDTTISSVGPSVPPNRCNSSMMRRARSRAIWARHKA